MGENEDLSNTRNQRQNPAVLNEAPKWQLDTKRQSARFETFKYFMPVNASPFIMTTKHYNQLREIIKDAPILRYISSKFAGRIISISSNGLTSSEDSL